MSASSSAAAEVHRRSSAGARLVYAALAIGTIGVGLCVHRWGAALGAVLHDALGDALWAAMIVWWVSALAPTTRFVIRGSVAYAICAAVEVSQLIHTSTLDAIRATIIGQLVLGSGFDARDLLAYAVGVAVAVLTDAVVVRRRIVS